MEPVTVHYKLSEKEYLDAAGLIATPRLPEEKFRRMVSYILVMPGLFLLLISLAVEWPMACALTVAFFTLLHFANRSNNLKLARRFYRGDAKFRHATTLTFTDENLTAQSKYIESKVGWQCYTDVLESETCYVLIYGKDLRMMTIVPKRAFQSKRQHLAFRELMGALFKRALPLQQLGEGEAAERIHEPRETHPDEYQPKNFEPPDWR